MSRPRHDAPAASDSEAPAAERLQKVLAAAGVGSRRACEALILAGRVEVDGQTVTQLGTKVTADQTVHVDGQAVRAARKVYYLVHKPMGVVTTNHDPSGRPRVIDLLPNSGERLFPVGRLDRTSTGLILVTNDGALAQRLTHPKYGIEKTYRVQIAGVAGREAVAKLLRGVHLAEGVARADSVRVRSVQKQSTWLEIILSEGKNREIRRILAKVGHKVLSLKRVAVGPLRLGELPPGGWRPLSSAEVAELWRSTRRKRKSEKRGAETASEPAAVAKLAENNEVFVADGITISAAPGQPPRAAAGPVRPGKPSGRPTDEDDELDAEIEAGFADDDDEFDEDEPGHEAGEGEEGELLVEEFAPGERPIGPVIGEDDEFVGDSDDADNEPDADDEPADDEPADEPQRPHRQGGRPPRFAQGRTGGQGRPGGRSGGRPGGKKGKVNKHQRPADGTSEPAYLLNSRGKRRKKPMGKRSKPPYKSQHEGEGAARPPREAEGATGEARPPRKAHGGQGRAGQRSGGQGHGGQARAGQGRSGTGRTGQGRPSGRPASGDGGGQGQQQAGGARPAGAKPRKPGKFRKKASGGGRPAFGKSKGRRKVRRGKGRT